MVAWCHGAPGLALARALVPSRARNAQVVDDVEAAMTAMLGAADAPLDHLCCGNMGRADVALTVGMKTGRADWMERGVRMAQTVANRILTQGRLGVRARGFWHGAPGPELMQGMAGIGYQLLRTASPSALPSVLAFEAPGITPGDRR
jgi:lantibiotic modifying enzyme